MNSTAKSIFFTYDGSHCQMANDGVYDKYKSYNIPKKQELLWLDEIKNNRINTLADSDNIKLDFAKTCSGIRKSNDTDNIDFMFDFLVSAKVSCQSENIRVYIYETFIETLIYLKNHIQQNKYKEKLVILLADIKNNTCDSEIARRVDFILNESIDELG